MATHRTPQRAATAVIENPTLPAGDDERFVGFAVMGPPFASGHYLVLRDLPATSFGPGYRSVWHRDPAGIWTFYATTPGQLGCARYFSSATPNAAVQCDIDVTWVTPWSLLIVIPGLLEWHVDIRTTPSTRLISIMNALLPARVWTNQPILGLMGRAAGLRPGAGQVRLCGTAPNGQRFMIAPIRVWAAAASRAFLRGEDLGPIGPLDRQARLGDLRPPQRGMFAVGHGRFETFDPSRHRVVERATSVSGRTDSGVGAPSDRSATGLS